MFLPALPGGGSPLGQHGHPKSHPGQLSAAFLHEHDRSGRLGRDRRCGVAVGRRIGAGRSGIDHLPESYAASRIRPRQVTDPPTADPGGARGGGPVDSIERSDCSARRPSGQDRPTRGASHSQVFRLSFPVSKTGANASTHCDRPVRRSNHERDDTVPCRPPQAPEDARMRGPDFWRHGTAAGDSRSAAPIPILDSTQSLVEAALRSAMDVRAGRFSNRLRSPFTGQIIRPRAELTGCSVFTGLRPFKTCQTRDCPWSPGNQNFTRHGERCEERSSQERLGPLSQSLAMCETGRSRPHA